MTTEERFVIAYDWHGWYWGGASRRWIRGLDQAKTYTKRHIAAGVAKRLNTQAEELIATAMTFEEAQAREKRR